MLFSDDTSTRVAAAAAVAAGGPSSSLLSLHQLPLPGSWGPPPPFKQGIEIHKRLIELASLRDDVSAALGEAHSAQLVLEEQVAAERQRQSALLDSRLQAATAAFTSHTRQLQELLQSLEYLAEEHLTALHNPGHRTGPEGGGMHWARLSARFGSLMDSSRKQLGCDQYSKVVCSIMQSGGGASDATAALAAANLELSRLQEQLATLSADRDALRRQLAERDAALLQAQTASRQSPSPPLRQEQAMQNSQQQHQHQPMLDVPTPSGRSVHGHTLGDSSASAAAAAEYEARLASLEGKYESLQLGRQQQHTSEVDEHRCMSGSNAGPSRVATAAAPGLCSQQQFNAHCQHAAHGLTANSCHSRHSCRHSPPRLSSHCHPHGSALHRTPPSPRAWQSQHMHFTASPTCNPGTSRHGNQQCMGGSNPMQPAASGRAVQQPQSEASLLPCSRPRSASPSPAQRRSTESPPSLRSTSPASATRGRTQNPAVAHQQPSSSQRQPSLLEDLAAAMGRDVNALSHNDVDQLLHEVLGGTSEQQHSPRPGSACCSHSSSRSRSDSPDAALSRSTSPVNVPTHRRPRSAAADGNSIRAGAAALAGGAAGPVAASGSMWQSSPLSLATTPQHARTTTAAQASRQLHTHTEFGVQQELLGGGGQQHTGRGKAVIQLPKEIRCTKCGVLPEQATPRSECRFHPALLEAPGALKFTPEWYACKHQGHTANMPGCFARKQHYFAARLVPKKGAGVNKP